MRHISRNKENITSIVPKRKHLNKRRAAVLTTLIFTTVITFAAVQKVAATTSPWTQTDWIGGTASGTVNSTVNTYDSGSNINVSTSGQISLGLASGWAVDYTNWSYRAPITITNSGSTLTDFQVALSIDTATLIAAGKMESDCLDIRLSDNAGTALPYWVETGKNACNTSSTYIWTKVPSLPNGNTNVYLYYGNSGATDGQDGDNVFEFFDDFSDGSIDGTKWTQGVIAATTGTNFSESGGNLVGGNTNRYIQSSTAFTGNYKAEARVYENTSVVNGFTSVGFYASNSNSWGTLVHNGTTYVRNNASWVNYGSFSRAKWTRDLVQVIGTSGYAERVAEDGSETKTYSATNASGISSENLRLSTRYDNSATNQNYVAYWDWIFVRKGVSTHPTSGSLGSEEVKYASSGTLTSNILNAEFAVDWGTLTYTTSGTGTITVKVRTDSNANMSGATAWGSCTGISSGNDITANACVTDTHQYAQYQITLEPSGANTPIFEDISIAFSASDQVAPDTNASSIAITGVVSGSWINSEPVITWTAGADNAGGNGLLGYCIALDEGSIGVSASVDPELSSGKLTGLDDGVAQNYCPFIVTGNSVNLSSIDALTLTSNKQYYFSIKAVDLAGNIYTGASGTYQDLVSFKYDNTNPTNVTFISTPSGSFGSVSDMFFTWPTSGGSAASDTQSGVIGWQYSIGNTTNWTGPDTEATLSINYIEDDGLTAEHYLTDGDDGANIVVGNNTVYFRTVDQAGNYSTPVSGGINYGGAAPTFTGGEVVTVTPATNTENSYGLSWSAATANSGDIYSYYYMINTSPPSTLATLQGNSSIYKPTNATSIATGVLTGSIKGTNTVYVVAVDDSDNYSPSNYISGAYTLNSTNPDPVRSLAASDTSIKSEEIWRAALAWSAPVYKGNGNLTYIIQRGTNNSTWETISTTTGLSYTDTVDESILYYYRVGVYDTSDTSTNSPTYATSVSITPKGTFDDPPTLSSGPTVSAITTKKATISWSTSRTADTKVQYGTKSGDYFDEEPSKSEQTTSHELVLTNLNPGQKYYFITKWTDEDGNTGLSDETTFTTDPRPLIKEASAKNIGIENAVIEFTSKDSALIKIYFGETTAFGGLKELTTGAAETAYTAELTGLKDNTKYYYKINSFDSEGEEYEGDVNSFTTLPRPQVSNVRIQQVKGTAQPTVLVSWNTNTEVSSIVSYYPDGNPGATRDEVNVALTSEEHRTILRGLLPQTRYVLVVSGRDKVGNEAISEAQTFTTSTDTRAPLITGLKIEGSNIAGSSTANNASKSQLVITWNTDEEATSQVEFGEGTGATYSQKTQEDTNYTFNHLVVISGLTPSKVYHLRVVSKDSVGNTTESIDSVTITPKATDSALDLVVTNLKQAFGFLGNLP